MFNVSSTPNILCIYFYGNGCFSCNMKYKILMLEEWQWSIGNMHIIFGKHWNSWLMFNYKKYTQFKWRISFRIQAELSWWLELRLQGEAPRPRGSNITTSGSLADLWRMWAGCKIFILAYLTTEIWMERQYFSQREVDPGAEFTRNLTILEGTRFKRATFEGQYCRSFGCCEDRDDGCVTQFYEADALCYCDKFCERENSDCCPDYKSFCHEEKGWPPHTKPWSPEGRVWEYVQALP